MSIKSFFLETYKNYGALIPLVFILLGIFGSYKILFNNIKTNADKSLHFKIENRTGDNIYFLRIRDSLTEDNNLNLKESIGPSSDNISIKARTITLNNNPKLLLWVIMMILMTATACGMLPAILDEIFRLIAICKPSPIDFILIGSFVIIIAYAAELYSSGDNGLLLSGFGIIKKFEILFHDTWPPNLIIRIVLGVASFAFFGMLFVNFSINRLMNDIIIHGASLPKLFKALVHSLKFFLFVISILIIFSVVTTSLLQQALNNVLKIDDFVFFPHEFIFAYGLVFSIFLAAVYIPVYHNLKVNGEKIVSYLNESNEIYNISDNEINQLELNENPLQNIKVSLTILAPLLTGVLSEILNQYP
jgi:hypothetical protein